MEEILRGEGGTATERYLAEKADYTFLNLWSYPNTFIDKKRHGVGDGKELCDLLVVFGDDVIIFSDKEIAWPSSPDLLVNWRRWFKRAVLKSVDQIRGAERWVQGFPARVFTDPACTQQIPVAFPEAGHIRFHRVVVTTGSEAACAEYFSSPDPCMMIQSNIRGTDHIDGTAVPFVLGDVDPAGPFVHVFDQRSLDLVMSELDTTADFVRYLTHREIALRNGTIAVAHSEADLVAFYFENQDDEGNHSLTPVGAAPDTIVVISEGLYAEFSVRPENLARIEQNESSYYWDKLIGLFTEHVLAGTSVAMDGRTTDFSSAEKALRIMASEDRVMRRALGNVFGDALVQAEKQGQDKFARIVLAESGLADPRVAYVFLILAYPKEVTLEGGYEQYRLTRIRLLETYCYSVLMDNRDRHLAVGIAIDASSSVAGREGGSQDLATVEVAEWTDELVAKVSERRMHYEVMVPERMKMSAFETQEFPSIQQPKMSRQQRRAAERRARK